MPKAELSVFLLSALGPLRRQRASLRGEGIIAGGLRNHTNMSGHLGVVTVVRINEISHKVGWCLMLRSNNETTTSQAAAWFGDNGSQAGMIHGLYPPPPRNLAASPVLTNYFFGFHLWQIDHRNVLFL